MATAEQPKIDEDTFAQVVFCAATLAPPARRQPKDPQVLRGQALFAQAQCMNCPRPSRTTGDSMFPRLSTPQISGQRIWPHTVCCCTT